MAPRSILFLIQSVYYLLVSQCLKKNDTTNTCFKIVLHLLRNYTHRKKCGKNGWKVSKRFFFVISVFKDLVYIAMSFTFFKGIDE